MKTWWKNYQISRALDERGRLNGNGVSRWPKAPQGRDFARTMEQLDAQLRQPVPLPPTPPDLHAAVMRAVRRAANRRESERYRWPIYAFGFTRAALTLLAVAGLAWWFIPRPANRGLVREQVPATFALATVSRNTLQAGKRVAQAGPAAVLAPLEREMALLESDVRKAAQFAIATLP